MKQRSSAPMLRADRETAGIGRPGRLSHLGKPLQRVEYAALLTGHACAAEPSSSGTGG